MSAKKTPKAKPATPAAPPAPAETPPPSKPKTTGEKLGLHMYARMLEIMRSHGAEEATETQKDFAATALVQIAPRNTAEGLLIMQMISCHEVGLNMLTRAKHGTSQAQAMESGALAAKLLGLFERQFSALERARRPQQTVTVLHEHRHVHVNAPGEAGEATIIQGQPYEGTTPAALAPPATPALPCATPEVAHPMPVAGDAQRSLPPRNSKPLFLLSKNPGYPYGGKLNPALRAPQIGHPATNSRALRTAV